MKNAEIAKLFNAIADILEYKNVEWKPRAYRNAAAAIESLGDEIEEYAKKGKLEDIPGVGEGLAKKIEEYLKTGKIKEYEKLKREVPKGIGDLLNVSGLGPRWVKKLNKELGVTNIKQLENAAKQHKIRKLEGFGEKSEENILKSIAIFRGGKERMLLSEAWPMANTIVERLKKLKEVQRATYAGSLIRMKETIGDLDILVSSIAPGNIMDYFTSMPEVKRVLVKGGTKSSVVLTTNRQIDLRVVKPNSWGSALQYFTGSKEHGVEMRKIAIKKGYKLNEYGLFKGGRKVAGKTEEEIYKILGMKQTPPPEIRENAGEIEGKIPKLVELGDIKGDLHVHTNWSDGARTIREMAIAAKSRGYEYIAITDHSKRTAIANGLDESRIRKQIKEIRRTKVNGIKILAGAEVDILPDGSLDFSDAILKQLDIVNASVHSGFKKDCTKRILTAMENKYVKIISHPTGRMIGRREPYQVDMEQLFSMAKEKNIWLEINAQPERLDLKDTMIRNAISSGVKLVISSDAHDIAQMDFMRFGVAQARRGWATKKDIVNCSAVR